MSPILLASFAIALVLAALVVAPLLLGRRSAADRAEKDAQVFRDQLAEIDRDLARGTISQAEAAGTRAEISRRLIAANRRAERAQGVRPAPQALSGLVAGVSLLLLPLLAAVVYFAEGSPGLPDQPLAQRGDAAAMASAQRPSQAEAESRVNPPGLPDTQEARDYAAMIDRLAEVVAERPEDEQGLQMLADGRFRLQRYAEAWPVYARLAEIRGPRADAALVARQAEAMVLAAGGVVTAEAEQVIDRALDLDAQSPTARFLDGLRHAQAGRLDPAMAVWEPLLQDAPADAQWRPWLRDMLAEARRLSRGAPAPGPDAGQMAAAQNLSPEERMEMIEGMVTRLETRLTERGGGPEDWVRLIRALSVLGRDDDARRIYDLSQQELKGSEAGFVREQALAMGVIEG